MTGHLPDALDTFRQNKQIIRKNELDDYGQGKIMVRTVNCNLCMNDTLHWHSEIELLHILTPDVKLYIEGEITSVDMGDSIAILPGALHDTFCPEGGSVLVIQFPPDGRPSSVRIPDTVSERARLGRAVLPAIQRAERVWARDSVALLGAAPRVRRE